MSLENRLKDLFTQKNLTIALAESCTGGLLAARITDAAGSSAYFLGGVVSYAYSAKEDLLGVSFDVLEKEGAVSETVVKQMARGARRRFGADVAIGITGIAGPGGGTAEKPVGLVWIGLSDESGSRAERFIWDSDREGNREKSVEAALEMLIAWAADH